MELINSNLISYEVSQYLESKDLYNLSLCNLNERSNGVIKNQLQKEWEDYTDEIYKFFQSQMNNYDSREVKGSRTNLYIKLIRSNNNLTFDIDYNKRVIITYDKKRNNKHYYSREYVFKLDHLTLSKKLPSSENYITNKEIDEEIEEIVEKFNCYHKLSKISIKLNQFILDFEKDLTQSEITL